MAITDLFSKRQRRLRGEVSDVFIYDDIPQELRVQVVHIWKDALGDKKDYSLHSVISAYQYICDKLCREYGLFTLSSKPINRHGYRHYFDELVVFLLEVEIIERALDVIEESFKVIDTATRSWNYLNRRDCVVIADNAIKELNTRFLEHGIGYQFTDGELIRVDSAMVHQEVVKPALVVLRDKAFAGAQKEFLKAYEHYRHGNNKEAMNESLKCLESVLKVICDKRNWPYDKKATAKPLLDICFEKKLIPRFWQSHYSSLRSLLESGVPTGRNKISGHGQGGTPTAVPPYIVAYLLHMTASAVLFLTEADNDRA